MNIRLFVILTLLGLTACSTFEQRAKEKEAVFSTLDTTTREKLSRGVVEIGYTTDMVFIALGNPDYTSQQISANGRDETWVYNSYFTEYRGTETVGYRRMVDYDSQAKTYRVYYEPVRVDVYRDRIEDRIRITFRGGRVTVIEQAK